MKVGIILLLGFLLARQSASSQDSLLWKKVLLYDGKNSIFPVSWLDKEINAKATEADTASFHNDSLFIAKAFSKYPDEVILKEVRKIYLLGKLRFNGENFFGTNSRYDLYIALNNNDEIERTFHHELSSMLFRNHPSYKIREEWEKLSPELLSTSSAAAMKAGYYSTEYAPELLEKGYFSKYSLSNWENDFNMYAEEIFCGGKTKTQTRRKTLSSPTAE
ncbi:MAG: hypothetical protein HZB42_06370 [Sphingobacteriales bacterium]|nr:hypothetical protein [Sphingobacteriales bacterium]